MSQTLLGFALIVTRISAFFLVLPVFGWKAIPVRIKVAATILLSVFFGAITPLAIDPAEVSTLTAIMLLIGASRMAL